MKHSSGYIVQSAGREKIEYIDEIMCIEVGRDIGPIMGLYKDSIRVKGEDNSKIDEVQKEKIIHRISDALEFMGTKYEWI